MIDHGRTCHQQFVFTNKYILLVAEEFYICVKYLKNWKISENMVFILRIFLADFTNMIIYCF